VPGKRGELEIIEDEASIERSRKRTLSAEDTFLKLLEKDRSMKSGSQLYNGFNKPSRNSPCETEAQFTGRAKLGYRVLLNGPEAFEHPLGNLRGIMTPVPTSSGLPGLRLAEFATVPEALDYAATGASGANLFSGRGELVEALPYRDLRDQAIELAHSMLGAGLRPGDRVAMIAETDGDFIRAFCACQYTGLVPAPLPRCRLPSGGRTSPSRISAE
jgi:AMP-binding enzyme